MKLAPWLALYRFSSPSSLVVLMLDKLSDFDFELPAEAIAQKPADPRESARLLYPQGDSFTDHLIADLPDLLRAGDLLVVNNTRVIPAQLTGRKGEGRIRFTLHKREASDSWQAFAKPAKKCTPGTMIAFEEGLSAEVTEKLEDGAVNLRFNRSGTALDAAIEAVGAMPLPPYIKRHDGPDDADKQDYQTVFAQHTGAVAAPTAGLHFTEGLKQRLIEKGVCFSEVTLHVGAGTFLPVKVEAIHAHQMHSEWGEVSAEVVTSIKQTKARGGRIICVGTTSLRILEAAYQAHGELLPFTGETDIFITPGYQFGVVDMLLTNFHLPRSTLLMLVSAFSGHKQILSAYHYAIEQGYRFFSYGDACLLSCMHKAASDNQQK
jgi:S-adenosylmethionine:tRNA ribosyltransferase-isomerase